jgi:hypothetical protein
VMPGPVSGVVTVPRGGKAAAAARRLVLQK